MCVCLCMLAWCVFSLCLSSSYYYSVRLSILQAIVLYLFRLSGIRRKNKHCTTVRRVSKNIFSRNENRLFMFVCVCVRCTEGTLWWWQKEYTTVKYYIYCPIPLHARNAKNNENTQKHNLTKEYRVRGYSFPLKFQPSDALPIVNKTKINTTLIKCALSTMHRAMYNIRSTPCFCCWSSFLSPFGVAFDAWKWNESAQVK